MKIDVLVYLEISAFYEAIIEDPRIGVYHISLYIALLRLRVRANWGNPIFVFRDVVCNEAKMSRRMYSKCMKDLVVFGYLRYEVSNDAAVGSRVEFRRL